MEPKDSTNEKDEKELTFFEKKHLETKQKELEKTRLFWDTQPVPLAKNPEIENKAGPIEQKELKDVRTQPYPLPEQFEWADVNLLKQEELDEVYVLLRDNYVEDDDGIFRFDYSREFLQWALHPPGYFPEWIFGVRVAKTKRLVAFITGIPLELVLEGTKIKSAEINFLCVHKKLRSQRLAPVLIKEVTRRVNLKNIWQAIYTAGRVIPTPISDSRYYHRSLNPKKLIDIGFCGAPKRSSVTTQVKLYSLPATTKYPFRPIKEADAKSVTTLLNKYLEQYDVKAYYSKEEVKHWFMSKKNVISTYVLTNKEGKVTDLLSYYSLPSTIINNPKHNQMKAAYSFYNVCSTISLKELISDLLILANNEEYDVFNALNIMDNESVFQDLLFTGGDGFLHFYLYNWKVSKVPLPPKSIGIVLMQ